MGSFLIKYPQILSTPKGTTSHHHPGHCNGAVTGLKNFKQSFFNIKHVERTEDFVSITISFTNNYVLCSLQRSIRNSLIHGFLKSANI